MASCINKSLGEYQSLKNMAGIPETALDFWCQYYLTKFDRLPYLDELPGVNSEQHLSEKLNIKPLGNLKISETSLLTELTGANSVEEGIIKLNNIYKDLEVSGVDVGNGKFFIDVKHRPTTEKHKTNYLDNYENTELNNRTVLVNSLSKLKKLYGIEIIPIDSSVFDTEEFQSLPSLAKIAKAFVFNGNVYVNIDYAGIESPIHELLHIFLGGMRYTNPEQYMKIISKLEILNMNDLIRKFGNKSLNDLMEEYFVSEFAKYLCGRSSKFSNMNNTDLQILLYNITRNIDSTLMGETTIKMLPANDIIKGSLLDLAIGVKSEIINQTPLTVMDLSEIHRKTSNIKTKLLENGDLIQKCE